MEKQDIIKARVPIKLRSDYEDICATIGILPSAKLREIVEDFVKDHYGKLDDRLIVHIHKPDDFDFGAWRVLIKLRNPKEMIWNGSPIPFHLPDLEKRRFTVDPDYRSVLRKPGTNDLMLGGQFKDGEFRSIMYSNGCREEENPSTIEMVREKFKEDIIGIIDRFKQ